MIQSRIRILPLVFLLTASIPLHAQFYKLHGASVSVGGTGQFTKILTSNTSSAAYNVPFGTGITTYPETVSNNQQYTTNSAGFVTSLQFHPVAWAGVEVNYGFTHYSERYTFNYSTVSGTQAVSIPTDAHEATGAYVFHPRHIKFQPFVNIGGGAIDFNPRHGGTESGTHMWRGAGLLETGLDIPTHNPHFGFRVEGRSLYYRAPNFYTSALSTHSWRATVEPAFSSYWRF